MRLRLPALAAVIVVAAATVTVAGQASADPPSGTTPSQVDLVGVGSDTTQGVMNHVADAYNAEAWGGLTHLYGFDATGSATITPKAGCAETARPNGSSAGISALAADRSTPPCIDYARSSRAKKTDGSEDGRAFFALARDGVTWVKQGTSNAPASLTKAQLAGIYTCQLATWDQVGGTSANVIKPYLPQSGSGTRSFWLSAIGVASPGACVTQGVPENNGSALPNDPDVIAPYSIANYIAQAHKGLDDVHGSTVPGQIGGAAPITGSGSSATLNARFDSTFLRTVYNVAKKTPLGEVAPHLTAVFGSSGYVCSNQQLVSDYGFGELGAECGSVS